MLKNTKSRANNLVQQSAGYKSTIQKISVISRYLQQKIKNEIKKTISLKIASNRIKYSGINLTKKCMTCTLNSVLSNKKQKQTNTDFTTHHFSCSSSA